MPRKALHYAVLATKLFLRGTGHTSVAAAIAAGCRTDAEWCIILRRCEQQFWSQHNRKARRAVKARHPIKGPDAGER